MLIDEELWAPEFSARDFIINTNENRSDKSMKGRNNVNKNERNDQLYTPNIDRNKFGRQDLRRNLFEKNVRWKENNTPSYKGRQTPNRFRALRFMNKSNQEARIPRQRTNWNNQRFPTPMRYQTNQPNNQQFQPQFQSQFQPQFMYVPYQPFLDQTNTNMNTQLLQQQQTQQNQQIQ